MGARTAKSSGDWPAACVDGTATARPRIPTTQKRAFTGAPHFRWDLLSLALGNSQLTKHAEANKLQQLFLMQHATHWIFTLMAHVAVVPPGAVPVTVTTY